MDSIAHLAIVLVLVWLQILNAVQLFIHFQELSDRYKHKEEHREHKEQALLVQKVKPSLVIKPYYDQNTHLSKYEREWIDKTQKKLDKQDFINSLPEADIIEEEQTSFSDELHNTEAHPTTCLPNSYSLTNDVHKNYINKYLDNSTNFGYIEQHHDYA